MIITYLSYKNPHDYKKFVNNNIVAIPHKNLTFTRAEPLNPFVMTENPHYPK